MCNKISIQYLDNSRIFLIFNSNPPTLYNISMEFKSGVNVKLFISHLASSAVLWVFEHHTVHVYVLYNACILVILQLLHMKIISQKDDLVADVKIYELKKTHFFI